MGLRSGRVTGRTISKNRDSEVRTVQLQVQITDTDDIQTVQLFTQAGDDTNPPDGATVMVGEVGEAWKVGLTVADEIGATVDPGEKKLYSQAEGSIKAFIYFVKDGSLELNGNSDFAVRFSELENAFNEFQSAYNGHRHGASSGTNRPSSADISLSRVDSIKVPQTD